MYKTHNFNMRLRTPQTFSQAKMRDGIRSASLHFCFQSSHLLSLISSTCSLISSYPLLTPMSCPCCAINDYPLLTPVSCPGSPISDHFVLTLSFFLYGNLISDYPILTPSVDPTTSLIFRYRHRHWNVLQRMCHMNHCAHCLLNHLTPAPPPLKKNHHVNYIPQMWKLLQA